MKDVRTFDPCSPDQTAVRTRQGRPVPLSPLAVGLLAGGLGVAEPSPQVADARGSIPVLQQITRNTTGDVLEPRLRSQEGNRIAFLSTGDVMGPGTATGQTELYLYEVAAGTTLKVTDTPGHGAWDAARPTDQIFAGSRPEVIPFVSTADLDPSVGNADHNPEVFLFEVQSRAFRQLTNTLPPVINREPYASDSAKCIAFVSSGDLDDNDGSDSGNNPPTGFENPDGSFEVFLYSTLSDNAFPTDGLFTQVSNAPSTAYESSRPVVGGYWFGRQCQTTAWVSDYDHTGGNRSGRKIYRFDRNSATIEEMLAKKEIPWGIVDDGGEYLNPSISSASNFARGPFIVFQTDADLWRNGSAGFEVFRYRVFHSRMTQYTDILFGDVERPSVSDGGGNVVFQSDGELLHPTRDIDGREPPFNSDQNREIFLMEGRRRMEQITDTIGCDNSAPSLRDDGTAIAFRSTCDMVGLNPGNVPQLFLYTRLRRGEPLTGDDCRIEDGCCNEANGCYVRTAGAKLKPRKKDCVARPRKGCDEPQY